MVYKPTGRPPGRPKTKEYVTLMARVPQDLAEQVKRYARLHRHTISEVLRDGVQVLLADQDSWHPRASDNHGDAPPAFMSDNNTSPLDTFGGESESAGLAELLSDTNTFALETLLSDMNRDKEFLSDTNTAQAMVSDTNAISALGMVENLSDTNADQAMVSDTPPASESVPCATGMPDYDPRKYFLGAPCRHGHDYQGTGRSLRRLSDQECLACVAARQARKRSRSRAEGSAGRSPLPRKRR